MTVLKVQPRVPQNSVFTINLKCDTKYTQDTILSTELKLEQILRSVDSVLISSCRNGYIIIIPINFRIIFVIRTNCTELKINIPDKKGIRQDKVSNKLKYLTCTLYVIRGLRSWRLGPINRSRL